MRTLRARRDCRGGRNAEIAFAITLQDRLIGSIGMRRWPRATAERARPESSAYWLGTPYWGTGYMTEALRALVNRMCSLTTPATRSFCGAFADNRASLRVQEKAGFVHRRRDDAVLEPARATCRTSTRADPRASLESSRVALTALSKRSPFRDLPQGGVRHGSPPRHDLLAPEM
jgi:RimJ/RimL family protein N-acetyltransferase